MSKSVIAGLVILVAFIVVLIMTRDTVTLNLFSKAVTLKASFALLGAAGIGAVVGGLLRK